LQLSIANQESLWFLIAQFDATLTILGLKWDQHYIKAKVSRACFKSTTC